MGYEIPGKNITLVAAIDLTAKQYHAVKLDSNGEATAITSVGEDAIGILQMPAIAGEAATVMVSGITKAIYGANITAGQRVMVNATGKIVPFATPAAGSTNYAIGRALESGVANQEGTILLGANPSVSA
ncbi:MAG TPA: DUF2190 family protein [Bacillota bacterium]|nr:DUF2190 family protein [Bacillota bacterium]